MSLNVTKTAREVLCITQDGTPAVGSAPYQRLEQIAQATLAAGGSEENLEAGLTVTRKGDRLTISARVGQSMPRDVALAPSPILASMTG